MLTTSEYNFWFVKRQNTQNSEQPKRLLFFDVRKENAMDGVTELAMKIKNLENAPYSPMIGKIISLPELKIQLGNRAQLDADDISPTFDIYEKRYHDGYTEYVNLNKEVVILPCYGDKGRITKFIAIGVIA